MHNGQPTRNPAQYFAFTQAPAARFALAAMPTVLLGLSVSIQAAMWLIVAIAAAGTLVTILYRNGAILYWCAAAACGLWIGAQTGRPLHGGSTAAYAEMPALFDGEITRILRSDTARVRCIVRGVIDARATPPYANGDMLLTIYRASAVRASLKPGRRISGSARIRLPRSAQLPTDFSEDRYCRSLGVQFVASTGAANIALRKQSGSLAYWAAQTAGIVKSRIEILFGERYHGLAIALLTGDKTRIPTDMRKTFAVTGTAHVLAVSGLHVGIIAVIVTALLGFVRGRSLKFILFTFAVAAFCGITGAQPSTLRAATMAVLILLVVQAQRATYLLNIVALTVIVLLLFDPPLLYSLSFQMSAGALLGIGIMYPVFMHFIENVALLRGRLQRRVAIAIAVSLAASTIVAPLAAGYFGTFSIISPLANLIVTPLMSLAMALAGCATLVSFAVPFAGELLASAAEAVLQAAYWCNNIIAEAPAAYIEGAQALPAALVASFAAFYVCTATSLRAVVFRLSGMCAAITLLFIPTSHHNTAPAVQILPRPQTVAVVVHIGEGKSVAIITDRNAAASPRFDPGLARYVTQSADSVLVIANGMSAVAIASGLERRNVAAVAITSYQFTHPRFWSAVDTLRSKNVRLIRPNRLIASRNAELRMRALDSTEVVWMPWNGTLRVSGEREEHEIELASMIASIEL